MAGLLDWLSDALGSAGQAATDPSTMGAMSSAGTPPVAPPQPGMPPVQMTGSDAQTLANPPGPQAPPTALGPDSPQNPTGGAVPMPMARPPGASAIPPVSPPTAPAGAPGPSAMPASIPPTAPMGSIPPNAAPIDGTGMAPTGARGFLDRAIGIDPNTKRSLIGGLGAGLTAASNSAGKSPFQAFTGGAGASMEGSTKADEKVTADQQKYLDQAIKAAQTGDTRALNQARTQLAISQAKWYEGDGKGGKGSVVNSDQQLYLRAQGATNQDANLKILKSQYDKIAMERGASSPEAKAAMDAYQKTYDDTLNGHLGRLGLDPKKADKIGKQPGMTQDNPVGKEKLTSQEAFDKLPPGSWFVNPKDGKILQKPMQPVQQPGAQPAGGAPAPGGQTLPAGQGGVPAAQPASNLPPLPPQTPQASAIPGLGADEDADEKEPA